MINMGVNIKYIFPSFESLKKTIDCLNKNHNVSFTCLEGKCMATVVLRMIAGKWKYSVARVKSVHILHEVGQHHLMLHC